MRGPALELTGVTKSYGGTPVLHGVDLTVDRGSLTALLGPSGCGKTTLLRLVAGFERPDGGSIAVDGTPVAGEIHRHLPPERRRIGYVPQEGSLFPHLTVAANVLFGLPRADRRARAELPRLLELTGLAPELADRYPHQLSGGQQQRAALARALAPRPRLVLLDEPFSALDAALRATTGRAVAEALRAVGATGLLVTHDQSEALSLADRVAVLRDGRLAQTATPQALYEAPADAEVAAFVGDAALLLGEAAGQGVVCALGMLPLAGSVPDGPVEVLLRPEQIMLGAVGRGVPATVAGVSYFGHDALVELRLDGGGERLAARIMHGPLPGPGAPVGVSVRGQVRAFRRWVA